jgi:hypothetical protein
MMENVSTATTSAQEQHPLNTLQLPTEEMTSPDEEWVAAMLDEIENNPEGSTTKNNVSAKNNILEMIINDSIGIDAVAEVCNETYTTLNPQDIDVSTEDEAPLPIPPTEQDVIQGQEQIVSASSSASTASSSDDEKYRHMRRINNLASQRCRRKKKNLMNAAFDELSQEEERNKELTIHVRVLEEQVKALKARFINRIANPTRDPCQKDPKRDSSLENSSSEWNSEQLERYVDDVANRHLPM